MATIGRFLSDQMFVQRNLLSVGPGLITSFDSPKTGSGNDNRPHAARMATGS